MQITTQSIHPIEQRLISHQIHTSQKSVLTGPFSSLDGIGLLKDCVVRTMHPSAARNRRTWRQLLERRGFPLACCSRPLPQPPDGKTFEITWYLNAANLSQPCAQQPPQNILIAILMMIYWGHW
jgi:hypothetical protein